MQIKTIMRHHLTLISMVMSKNSQITNAEEGVEKREPFCIAVGNVSWCSHYGEHCACSFKNYK